MVDACNKMRKNKCGITGPIETRNVTSQWRHRESLAEPDWSLSGLQPMKSCGRGCRLGRRPVIAECRPRNLDDDITITLVGLSSSKSIFDSDSPSRHVICIKHTSHKRRLLMIIPSPPHNSTPFTLKVTGTTIKSNWISKHAIWTKWKQSLRYRSLFRVTRVE